MDGSSELARLVRIWRSFALRSYETLWYARFADLYITMLPKLLTAVLSYEDIVLPASSRW